MAERDLSDYIEVAERIEHFRAKYPEGTLTGSTDWTEDGSPFRILQAQGFDKNGEIVQQTFIVYVALAYRSQDDRCPGMGVAWEIFPGRTPYTRGSELQNAETSAWGRAIIAVGASDSKRGIASREEVRNQQAEREDGLPTNADGSLSRSRTSDAEKQAAGVMTDAEQRAHNQLERKVLGTDSKGRFQAAGEALQRLDAVDAVVDDRWTSDAPSWLVGVDPPEDQPGSILPAQRSQIMAVYTSLGIKAREARLLDMQNVLATGDGSTNAITSTNDLSHQQAARLLENLHDRHTGKMTRR